jgi:hypothetical protein
LAGSSTLNVGLHACLRIPVCLCVAAQPKAPEDWQAKFLGSTSGLSGRLFRYRSMRPSPKCAWRVDIRLVAMPPFWQRWGVIVPLSFNVTAQVCAGTAHYPPPHTHTHAHAHRAAMWAWESGVTPHALVRALGPFGPGLCERYVSNRFTHHGE